MRIMDLAAPDCPLDRVYRDVLAPSFPPDELVSLDGFREGVARGSMEGLVALDDGRPVGVAVAEWTPECRVLLLSYLAVSAAGRGGGIGSRLYREALDGWRDRYRPCLILAEVERPDRHDGSLAHGDPTARLRFYGRHGAQVIDLPYFQPALGHGCSRVYGMLLLALHVDPELSGPAGDPTVAGAPLRVFLTDYLVGAEGMVADDPATRGMLRATEAAGGVRMLPTGRYQEILAADPPVADLLP